MKTQAIKLTDDDGTANTADCAIPLCLSYLAPSLVCRSREGTEVLPVAGDC